MADNAVIAAALIVLALVAVFFGLVTFLLCLGVPLAP